MKKYILFLILCFTFILPNESQAREISKIEDNHDKNTDDVYCNDISHGQSIWLRNTCWNGYLVLLRGEDVVAQHSGISSRNESVEIIRQSCLVFKKEGMLIRTRYYAKKYRKYICFNKCGRLVTKSKIKPNK